MKISFSIDKKLIFLVIAVSITSLSITAYLSFSYAEQILVERTNDLLLGEAMARGNSIKTSF